MTKPHKSQIFPADIVDKYLPLIDPDIIRCIPGKKAVVKRRRCITWYLAEKGYQPREIALMGGIASSTVHVDLNYARKAVEYMKSGPDEEGKKFDPKAPELQVDVADELVADALNAASAAVVDDPKNWTGHRVLQRWVDIIYQRHGAYAEAHHKKTRGDVAVQVVLAGKENETKDVSATVSDRIKEDPLEPIEISETLSTDETPQ